MHFIVSVAHFVFNVVWLDVLSTFVRGFSPPSNVIVFGGNSQALVFFTPQCDGLCFINDDQCFSNFSSISNFSDGASDANATYFVAANFFDLYGGSSYESPIEIFGLENGVAYNFSVLARNSSQFGDPSNDSVSIVAGIENFVLYVHTCTISDGLGLAS